MPRTFPHVVIRASAGTGKTFQLSNRFLGLAAGNERPDRILATTFARKAAGEILDRVLLRLAEAADNPSKLADLARHLEEPALNRDRCLELLKTLTRLLHRLRIGTLDSFFIQLAGSFGLELGLPPGWQIVDELQDRELRREAVRRVLQGETTADLVTLMNLLSKGEVRRSVADQMGDVITDLYDLYCQTEHDAWHALPRHKPLDADELTIAVAALAALKDFPNGHFIKAHKGDVANAQTEDWESFVGKGLGKAILDGKTDYQRKPIDAEVVAAYEPLIEHARAVLVGHLANQTESAWRLLDRFEREYQQLKTEQRALRFEDVTRRLAGGLAGLAIEDLSYRLDTNIAHLLLDEFQDTSLAQWAVVRLIAQAVTDPPPGKSFFCVGDVKQAIYGWRGGISEIFDAVGEELAGLTFEPLNESYRSSQPVIDTVNRVFTALPRCTPLEKYPAVTKAWAERFSPHTTARRELTGYARLLTASRALPGMKQADETLTFAAAQIAELARQNPGRSIGVLVRRNQAVARLIFELRNRHQVRASEEGGNPVTDSAAVQLLLSVLTLADHPGDGAARYHVAHSPLGPHLGLEHHADQAAARRLSLAVRQELMTHGYGRTLYGWVQALAPSCDERELSRLMQLVELAYGYESRATIRADDFVRYVSERKVEDPTAADVRVMTVHQSKGLQFDIVVLPELDGRLTGRTQRVVVGRSRPIDPIQRVCRYVGDGVRKLLPLEIQRMFEAAPDQQVNEALCVLYVALTRAVHALHIIVSPSAENEKTLHATYAGLLRATLTDGAKAEPETVLWEHGDPNWAVDAGPAGEPAGEAPPPVERLIVRLAPPRHQPHGLERLAPSAGRQSRVNLATSLRIDNVRALTRGTLLHAWYQQIEWLENGPPDDALLRRLGSRYANLDLRALLKEFRNTLQQPALRQVLSRTAYAEPGAHGFHDGTCAAIAQGRLQLRVYRERPFAFREAETLIRGTVDRLVLAMDGDRPVAADLIDFKSDAVEAENAAALDAAVQRHRSQMEDYRRAVARMTGLEPEQITARLLFVEPGAVRRVT